MAYIAKTNGATSGQPLEIREGFLTDITVSERVNWRQVNVLKPTVSDNQVLGTPTITINGDGTVDFSRQVDSLPVVWGKMNLRRYLRELRIKKENSGIVFNGIPLDTTDTGRSKIFNDYIALQQGWVSSITYATSDDFVTASNATQLANACQAITQYRQSLITTEQTLIGDIESDTITTKSQIDGYAWPTNVY